MLQQITVRVELGAYVLRGREVEFLEVRQRVGAHAECSLAFSRDPKAVASSVAQLRVAELAGAALRVVFVANGAEEFFAFDGTVRHAEIEHQATGAGEVSVLALSDSYMLDEHVDRKYFREHGPAVLAEAFGLGVAGTLPAGETRDYIQAGVSAWTFLNQVAAGEGLQLRPLWPRTPDASVDYPAEIGKGFGTELHVLTWGRELIRFATSLAPVNAGVTGAFYEPGTKHDHRFRGVRAAVDWLDGAKPVVSAAESIATSDADGGDPGHAEIGCSAGSRARTLTEFRTRMELASARRMGSAVRGRGVSVMPALRAGDQVRIDEAPGMLPAGEAAGPGPFDEHVGTFGLVQVTHRWTGTLYENQFEATPWKGFHLPPTMDTTRAEQGAPQAIALGVVVSVTDPKGMGRIKVRYGWMEESEATHWVRVAGLGGGNGRGVGVLPSVGDEVVVAAVAGDPEHPIVLGALWNGVDKAGHAPGRQHWVTPAGNTLVFTEGKAGEDKETVELYTKEGKTWVQLAAKGPGGVPLVTVRSAGDLSLEAPDGELRLTAKSMLTHVTGAHATEVGGEHTLKATGAVTVESGARLAMKSGAELALRAGAALRAHGGAGQTLTGSTLALNPPGATAPTVQAQVPQAAATAWSAKPVPGPGPGRSTQDPKTPTRRELAQQSAPAPAAPATTSGIADPQWTQVGGGAVTPAPGSAASGPPARLTAEQQKLRDVKALLQQSATGRTALQQLDANNVPVGFRAGGGSYWDGAKIVIDQTQNTQMAALTLVHEANHAVASLTGVSGNALTQTRAAYLQTMINEEAVGTVRSIVTKRELIAAGVPITANFPLESQFNTAYTSAVSALTRGNPAATAAAQLLAGDQAGLARVVQGFTAGEVVTSNNGQPYPQYYGSYWDTVHPPPPRTGP